ncbi:MAG TPA: hypothetical protein VFG47_03345, partial [Geminicoccaceae bacterium]|nr:hypothetical protein [Geminicoccaceae bacterium]
IWLESHPMAPSFNKVAYTSLEVDANSADWETAHRGSDSYKWQRKIRDYIYEKTGLGLADHEFKVSSPLTKFGWADSLRP